MECKNCGGRVCQCYIKKRVDGKSSWVAVGLYCHGCRKFFKA